MTEKTVGSEDIIVCRDVHKWYGDFHVLRGITTTIKKREVVVVFGPSRLRQVYLHPHDQQAGGA